MKFIDNNAKRRLRAIAIAAVVTLFLSVFRFGIQYRHGTGFTTSSAIGRVVFFWSDETRTLGLGEEPSIFIDIAIMFVIQTTLWLFFIYAIQWRSASDESGPSATGEVDDVVRLKRVIKITMQWVCRHRRMLITTGILISLVVGTTTASVLAYRYSWIGHTRSEYTPAQIEDLTGLIIEPDAIIYRGGRPPNSRSQAIDVSIVTKTLPKHPTAHDLDVWPNDDDPARFSSKHVLSIIEHNSHRRFNKSMIKSYHSRVWTGPKSPDCYMSSIVMDRGVVTALQWWPP